MPNRAPCIHVCRPSEDIQFAASLFDSLAARPNPRSPAALLEALAWNSAIRRSLHEAWTCIPELEVATTNGHAGAITGLKDWLREAGFQLERQRLLLEAVACLQRSESPKESESPCSTPQP